MAVQGLEYIISLTDQISAPLRGISKQIEELGSKGKEAISQIGMGMAAVVATGLALKNALDPAIEFNRALAEVEAAGVSASGLQKVSKFALDFSSTFGISSKEVVNSVNEIARAIDGLTEDELISFAEGSNILAKATGSSVQEMGSYLSTMYGIFQQEADQMGKAKWVKMMAGQATLTANMFKSSGESLSQAFTNLMSTGQSKGIALAEQFAVLGNLQSVMPGGMSGTKYAAFLKGVGKAQQKLGLDFLDSQNRMRPITEILTQIKNSYGDTIDEVEALQLSKAFGSDDAVAVINYLLPKIDQLKDNIKEIGDIDNLDDAIRLSKMTTDPWARLAEIIQNIKVAIGTEILRTLDPIMTKIANMGQAFQNWLSTYKNLAWLLGVIVGIFMSMGAVVGVITIFSGFIAVLKIVAVAFVAIVIPVVILAAKIMLVVGVIYLLRNYIADFIAGFIKGFKQAGVSFDPLFSAFNNVWQSIQKIASAIGRVINLLFGANDGISTWANYGELSGRVFGEALNIIISLIEAMANGIAIFADTFVNVVNIVITMWQKVIKGFEDGDILGALMAIGEGILAIFSTMITGIKNAFINMVNWAIKQINKIPGVEIPLIPVVAENAISPVETGADTAVASQSALMATNIAGIAMQSAQLAPIAMPNEIKPNTDVQQGALRNKVNNSTNNINRSINIQNFNVSNDDKEQWEQHLRNRQQLQG